jgi:hypothetical protein
MSLTNSRFAQTFLSFFSSVYKIDLKPLSKWNKSCLPIRLILRSSHDTSRFLYLTNYPSLYLIHSLPFINLVCLSSTLLMLHLNTKVCRSKSVSPLLLLSTSAPCPGSLCSDEVLLSLGAFPAPASGEVRYKSASSTEVTHRPPATIHKTFGNLIPMTFREHTHLKYLNRSMLYLHMQSVLKPHYRDYKSIHGLEKHRFIYNQRHNSRQKQNIL